MEIIKEMALKSNRKMKINFDGGNLSTDGGLILLHEFMNKIGFDQIIGKNFKTTDHDRRLHTDTENLKQVLFQWFGAYFRDDHADALTHDPVFTTLMQKERLASQPTLSRFFGRMDEKTLAQFECIAREIRKIAYSIKKPEEVLLDVDSTLLDTYGKQEGEAFNYHYQQNGYHPLVCYNSMTGELLKIALRSGSTYTSTGVVDFLKPLIDSFETDYPDIPLFLRGDSGFATPDLYSFCEEHDIAYAIHLKSNSVLHKYASDITNDLMDIMQRNIMDYAVCYGEFEYQANSWEKPRRVVCKVEKPSGQMVYMHTFIVTNLEAPAKRVVAYYGKRGNMENFIKESKNDFDFAAVGSKTLLANANRLQVHALCYNLFLWFKLLVLPENMKKQQAYTLRLSLLKIAVKVVKTARSIWYKLCSSFPNKHVFFVILNNVEKLCIQNE